MQRKVFLLGAGVTLLAGAGQLHPLAAQPATIAEAIEATAIVESVGQTQRSVLLRGPNGALLILEVGPEVRNLAQVNPGDRVVVHYRECAGR
jgi:hypothetical protein